MSCEMNLGKRCPVCGHYKQAEAFHRAATCRDGRKRICGSCVNKRSRDHRASGESVYYESTNRRLRSCWRTMRARCSNPKHPQWVHYGGRGITVCARWASFELFRKDMSAGWSPELCIDRVDNDGPYSPDNCRWVSYSTNNRNRRNSRLITAFGRTQTLAAWVEESPVGYATLYGRLAKGWVPEAAISTPSMRPR